MKSVATVFFVLLGIVTLFLGLGNTIPVSVIPDANTSTIAQPEIIKEQFANSTSDQKEGIVGSSKNYTSPILAFLNCYNYDYNYYNYYW
uniref:Putative conserved secreted protein n=1 Tax=Culex tarsalis TaxID=7177 RepID=A0A1Q3FAW3_CULTA